MERDCGASARGSPASRDAVSQHVHLSRDERAKVKCCFSSVRRYGDKSRVRSPARPSRDPPVLSIPMGRTLLSFFLLFLFFRYFVPTHYRPLLCFLETSFQSLGIITCLSIPSLPDPPDTFGVEDCISTLLSCSCWMSLSLFESRWYPAYIG